MVAVRTVGELGLDIRLAAADEDRAHPFAQFVESAISQIRYVSTWSPLAAADATTTDPSPGLRLRAPSLEPASNETFASDAASAPSASFATTFAIAMPPGSDVARSSDAAMR